MSGWHREPFDAVIDDESGGNVKTPQREFLSSGRYPIIDQGKELVAGYTDDESRLCRAELPVIIFGDHTRCFKYVDFPFCMGADGVKVLRPKNGADAKYLYHYLRHLRLTEGGYDRHFKYLRRTSIALPSLPEQRRIAEILDKADALRAKRRAALAQLDTLTQSMFLEMFGDPATNPKGWPQNKLEDLCSIDAPFVDPTREEYRQLLHYGPDRIERGTGTLLLARTAAEDGVTSGKFLFDEHSVLYSKIRPNLNKVALAKERALCSADVYPIRVRRERMTREFLWCLLRDRQFLSYTAELSNRANIPKINRDQLLRYPALCPPLPLQQDFSRQILAVDRLRSAFRRSAESIERLFTSLQYRGFQGEL